VLLDVVERADMLQDLIGTADLVVSLLPSTLHYLVAEACINAGVHLVTASYCTDELKDMHDRYMIAIYIHLLCGVRSTEDRNRSIETSGRIQLTLYLINCGPVEIYYRRMDVYSWRYTKVKK
jgi:hypothetical protein